jgi:hypothetical protein
MKCYGTRLRTSEKISEGDGCKVSYVVCEELFLPSQLVKKSLNFKDEIS